MVKEEDEKFKETIKLCFGLIFVILIIIMVMAFVTDVRVNAINKEAEKLTENIPETFNCEFSNQYFTYKGICNEEIAEKLYYAVAFDYGKEFYETCNKYFTKEECDEATGEFLEDLEDIA